MLTVQYARALDGILVNAAAPPVTCTGSGRKLSDHSALTVRPRPRPATALRTSRMTRSTPRRAGGQKEYLNRYGACPSPLTDETSSVPTRCIVVSMQSVTCQPGAGRAFTRSRAT